MKIVKKVLLFFIFLIAVTASVGFFLPQDWAVERSIVIKAPKDQIYPYVANFRDGWLQWSSFDKQDPSIEYRYEGELQGAGAKRSWTSSKMGNGSQEITKADIENGIEFTLTMDNQFKINGFIRFETLENGTKVTWKDWGTASSNPFQRIMVNLMDFMMGKAFEESLTTLKSKVELGK